MTQILASVDDNNRGACLNNVWNSDTLAWEKMEQPVLEATDSNINVNLEDIETILTDGTQKTIITDGTNDADVVTCDGHNGLVTITPGHVSTVNSTTLVLAGGATFTGTAEDVTNFGVVAITVKASHASATDGLKIQMSSDGTNWDNDDVYTIAANTAKVFTAQCSAKYFRVTYTNGATLQTYFRLQTVIKPYYVKPSSHRIKDNVSAEDDAELVKAQLVASLPSGDMTNINSTTGGNLKVSIEEFDAGSLPLPTMTSNEYMDAFSNIPVAQPQTLFDAQFTYGLQPLLYQAVTSGGATVTHDTTNNCALMTLNNQTGDAYLQSYEYMRYQPGKGQRIFITFNMNGGVADCKKFARYGDANENYQFVLDGTTPKVQINTSSTTGNQTASQAGWNVDTLDGNGASGVSLNFEKEQILIIDFQALYVGRVRFGFDVGGVPYWCHYFNNANNTTKPYIKTANLPVACGMISTANVTTTMDFNCCSVISYGGLNETVGYSFTVEGTGTAGNSVRAHILSVRPKTTFNSITNRTQFVLEGVDLLVTGNTAIKWELVLGQAISGTTTFAPVNDTYSAIEFNTAGAINGDPTIVIATGYLPASAATKSASTENVTKRYPLTLDAAGAVRSLGTLSLIATGLGATSTCRASISWREVR